MTERQATTYGVTYEEPPKRGRGPGEVFSVLQEVANDASGEWARVATCPNKSGANGILSSIRSGKRVLPQPVEFYDFTTRTFDEDGVESSGLWAKWIGAEGAAAAKEAAEARAAAADATPTEAPVRRGPGRPRRTPVAAE